MLYTNNVVCPWIALPGGWLESCSDMESCSGITHNILFIDCFQGNFRFLLDGHLPVRRPQYLPEGGQLALRHPPPGGQLPAAPFDFTSPSGTVTAAMPPSPMGSSSARPLRALRSNLLGWHCLRRGAAAGTNQSLGTPPQVNLSAGGR